MATDLPSDGELTSIRHAVISSLSQLRDAAEKVMRLDAIAAACVATPFLKMFGVVIGASLLAKQAGIAATRIAQGQRDHGFLSAKIATASFYIEEVLPQASALSTSICHASPKRLFAMEEEQFAQ